MSMLYRDTLLRRAVDVTVGMAGVALSSPLLVAVAAAIRLTSPGKVIYRQVRVGRDGELFEILKFRTMVVGADRAGPLVSGRQDPRVTPVGRWLRGTRLDELPQLLNLIKGDVTLIGPRPEVPRFLPYYQKSELHLLGVRPGIIGPGAILFADSQSDQLDTVPDPEAYYVSRQLHPKLALDRAYLAERSVRRDISLLKDTVRVLAK
jgi:lipopolysaccharide/colanic/teichoic acid biosynthesis glycosyltransferase